ncbi:alpha/beta-hydrolase [Lichtheimia hyalospora FSU 10163]|nr:alpha/beta-hydrolase [Lichtheimia hyalospora FSU 10163]
MSIEPFEVPSFTPEQLSLLKERLRTTVYPNELEANVGWEYGAPTWAVKPLVQAWLQDFDWEKSRKEMNQWHHYRTTIQDLKIHFIHEPSNHPDAVPLLLINGWPSTFYEYHKVIQPLRDGELGGQPFHVIVPSLPGYGFSDPPKLTGHGVPENGEILAELMHILGYDKYLVHGSDWGSVIGRSIAVQHKEHCKGYHTVMPTVNPPLPTLGNILFHPLKVAKLCAGMIVGFDTVYGAGKFKLKGKNFADAMGDSDAGYRAIQGTRPYTLSQGLSDSPAGLLSWMLEKFHNWTYHPAQKKDTQGLPDTITPDEFLTHVSIYWLTNTMSSSMRIYYEAIAAVEQMTQSMDTYVQVPTAVGYFPSEMSRFPREWLEYGTNLQQWNEFDLGGHFPAMEEPELFVTDIQTFGKKLKAKKAFD